MAEAIYMKIKELIYDNIKDKPANSPIDSERELAAKFHTSRMTARKAVNALVEEGILYRDKNKGTFVSDEKLRKKNTSTVIFESEADTIQFKVLYFNVKEADAETAKKLEIEKNDLVLRVVRLNTLNGVAQSVEEITIVRKDIEDKKLGDLKNLLDLNQYLENGSVTQIFNPILVPLQYANLLKLKINTPIICIDYIINSKLGKPMIYIKAFNHPTEKVIEITT